MALALASERPKAKLTATDVSPAALAVARANAERLELSGRVRFLEGSLYQPVSGERFDLVVLIPPPCRIDAGARHAPSCTHDRRSGSLRTSRASRCCGRWTRGGFALAPGSAAAFEISPEQADRVAGWCREAGLLDVTRHRDLARRVRVVSGRLPAERS